MGIATPVCGLARKDVSTETAHQTPIFHKKRRHPPGCLRMVYLPATLRPSTRVVGAPKVVLPMALGRWLLLARAVIFFSSS